MLKPTKHLNPETSTLSVAAQILKAVHNSRTISYNQLYHKLYRKNGDQLRETLLPALGFLYLLGTIEYHEKTDSFEYREHRGTAQ
jgi:hypothetical protein